MLYTIVAIIMPISKPNKVKLPQFLFSSSPIKSQKTICSIAPLDIASIKAINSSEILPTKIPMPHPNTVQAPVIKANIKTLNHFTPAFARDRKSVV